MTDLAQQNLGLSAKALADKVAEALNALGAIDEANAVITDFLAQQMVRMGVHSSSNVIGGTIGSRQMIEGSLSRFARYLGGPCEPWRGYEWALSIHPDVRRTPFRKGLFQLRRRVEAPRFEHAR
jgi:hypothetical protein